MIETKMYNPKASVHHRFTTRGVRHRKRPGAMMALIVLLLPMLLIVAALAINLAHIESTKTDIQIANDAAARSAGRVYSTTGDRALALAAAQEAAAMNPVGNQLALQFEDSDLTIGTSVRGGDGLYEFTPSSDGNSVRLTTQSLADGRGVAVKPLLPIFGFQSEIRPTISTISTQADIDISIVIDRSGSMAYAADEVAEYPPYPAAAPDGWDFGMAVPPRSRWLDMVAAVDVFRQALNQSHQQELIALTFYDDEASAVLNLTNDYSQLDVPLNAVSDQFDSGGTNIGGGMSAGLDVLFDSAAARADAAKVIIVLTDGVHNSGTQPVSAAKSIAGQGVIIFTITFSDEANEKDMEEVAKIGNGSHFHALTPNALQQAFISISKQLPTLITK